MSLFFHATEAATHTHTHTHEHARYDRRHALCCLPPQRPQCHASFSTPSPPAPPPLAAGRTRPPAPCLLSTSSGAGAFTCASTVRWSIASNRNVRYSIISISMWLLVDVGWLWILSLATLYRPFAYPLATKPFKRVGG